MKIKLALPFISLFFCTVTSLAQEIKQTYLGLETGITFFESDLSNTDYIRKDMSSYFTDYSSSSITSSMYKSYVGIKPEIFTLNKKFGLLAGIHYSRINSSIGKNDYWSDNADYFYLRIRQDGINTEYLKVKKIKQMSDYIGIPIEVRYFPFRPRLFRLYFKLGAEINYLLQSQTDVTFDNHAMNPFQKDVKELMGDPKSFSSSIYASAGFRLGRESKPSVSFEVCLPSIFLTSESSSLANPLWGAGFQLNVQIPLNTKVH